jgi:hypothetical protein
LSINNLFLVSSAINAKHGIYSSDTRILQTIQTCLSIAKTNSSSIIILDGGSEKLSENQTKQLSKYCNGIINFSESDYAKHFQSINNWDIVKNGIEIYMFKCFMKAICENNIQYPETIKRIYKISGRYILNDTFNSEIHLRAKNKIVIKKEMNSQFDSNITNGIKKQYMSRLWSFDISLREYIKDFYEKSFDYFKIMISNGKYIDIEHLLYYFLDKSLIKKVKTIGVTGTIASNGLIIID